MAQRVTVMASLLLLALLLSSVNLVYVLVPTNGKQMVYRRFPSLSPAAPRVAGPVGMMGVAIRPLRGARAVSGRSLWASARRSGANG